MAHPPQLVASFFTLAGDVSPWGGMLVSPHDLRERAEAASRAGYAGMGFVVTDMFAAIERHGLADVRTIFSDNGITYLELEAIPNWFADAGRRAAAEPARRATLDIAERLGVWNIKVLGDLSGRDWPVDHMASSFQELCRDAAPSGAQITIEIFPTSNIRELTKAVAVVDGADMANGGLLLDIWHMTRGGIPYEDFDAIPAHWIKAVELNDATALPIGDIMEDSCDRRRLPGEGEFDIPRFLSHIRNSGFKGPYGVEIVSEAHRKLPIAEAAQRSYSATIAQFAMLDAGG